MRGVIQKDDAHMAVKTRMAAPNNSIIPPDALLPSMVSVQCIRALSWWLWPWGGTLWKIHSEVTTKERQPSQIATWLVCHLGFVTTFNFYEVKMVLIDRWWLNFLKFSLLIFLPWYSVRKIFNTFQNRSTCPGSFPLQRTFCLIIRSMNLLNLNDKIIISQLYGSV